MSKQAPKDVQRKWKIDQKLNPTEIKQTIVGSQERYEKLAQNYQTIEKGIVEREKESFIFKLMQTYAKENTNKQIEEEIIQLQNLIATQKADNEKKLNKFKIQKDNDIKNEMEKKREEIKEMNDKYDRLREERDWLKQFPDRKVIKLDQITELEIQLQEKKLEYQKELEKQDKNFTVQRTGIEQKANEEIDKEKSKALQYAQQGIESSEQTIKENAKLLEQLQLHQEEIDQLRFEREEIISQNESFKSGLDQNSLGIGEYQNINHKQSVKIKKLKEKIEYLKNFIDKEVKNYDDNIEKVKNEQLTKIDELEYELKNLSDQLRKKVKEIKHIKGLSQMVLDQRSDIEQFFLESLDQVRQENYRLNKINQKNDPKPPFKLPDISQRSQDLSHGSI